mgnify:CR=1 FL=1
MTFKNHVKWKKIEFSSELDIQAKVIAIDYRFAAGE